jgi:hypothetical protein
MPALRNKAASEFGNSFLRSRQAAYEKSEPDVKKEQRMKMIFNEINDLIP